ncbi:thioredoxin [Escherichia phage UPWr_E4]
MTRNEYIKSFNSVIDDKVKPVFSQNSVISIINQWLNNIDASIVSSSKFIHEVHKISSREYKDDIKETFKGSRLLSYLVNQDILGKFGKEIKRTKDVVGYSWFGDVNSYHLNNKEDPENIFTRRWISNFRLFKKQILKSTSKLCYGDYRQIHPWASDMIIIKEYELDKNKAAIFVNYEFFTPEANQKNINKFFSIASDTTRQLETALLCMETVENIHTYPFKNICGWEGYKIVVSLREVKCAYSPTNKEIYQQKCEEIVNTPKEETTLEELMDSLDDSPESVEIRPEVIALEKAYKEVLEISNKAQKEYEQAKRIWEESVNRLDRLEQALQLIK